MDKSLLKNCSLCPKACKADRTKHFGICKANDKLLVARAALHAWEEPCISGTKGSGTIFFSGCPMQCIFCQNHVISHNRQGKEITPKRLGEIMLTLQSEGAHNINLVTATPYVYHILEAYEMVKDSLHIPIAYNSGGYETTKTIGLLKDMCKIYMPDFKYWDDGIAKAYSNVTGYRETAKCCIIKMYEQAGPVVMENGILKQGVLIRHLVLPSHKKDSELILRWISDTFGKNVLVSLMSQYTPPSVTLPKAISRKLTTYEYQYVLSVAENLNIEGFMQERSSASECFTPSFLGEGV